MRAREREAYMEDIERLRRLAAIANYHQSRREKTYELERDQEALPCARRIVRRLEREVGEGDA